MHGEVETFVPKTPSNDPEEAGRPDASTPEESPASQGRDRRRSERTPYYKPLIVTWIRNDGVRVHEYAGAEDISAHGCLLKMTTPVPKGAVIDIRHPRHKTHVRGKVIRALAPGEDGLLRIAVDLDTPRMIFWLLEAVDDDGVTATPLPSELI